MERKTYIVTVDEKSSCVGVMPAFGNSRYDKVTITKPVSVTALDGYPKLYTSEVLDKERQAGEQAGQNEAWELAQKILELPSKGGYTPEELIDIFGSDAVPYAHDLIRRYTFHDVVTKIHEREEKKAKEFHPGDVVKLHWGGEDNRLAVVTWTKPGSELLGIVLDDGNVGDIVKSQCSKTGKTLNVASLLCELNEEEE
jgi:hypothetical protein